MLSLFPCVCIRSSCRFAPVRVACAPAHVEPQVLGVGLQSLRPAPFSRCSCDRYDQVLQGRTRYAEAFTNLITSAVGIALDTLRARRDLVAIMAGAHAAGLYKLCTCTGN